MKKAISLFILIFFAATTSMMAQSSTVSVMEVRVEVVTGVSIATADTVKPFDLSNENVTNGEIVLNLPEGTEILTSAEEQVQMVNGTSIWALSSRLQIEQRETNTYRFTFRNGGVRNVGTGVHRGVQTTTIEYL